MTCTPHNGLGWNAPPDRGTKGQTEVEKKSRGMESGYRAMMKYGTFLFALAGMVALSPSVLAGAAPEEAISLLQERGYTDIEIEPDDSPGYQAWACKGGTRFSVLMDPESNIVDVDPVGHCGAPAGQGPSGDVYVKAPFADVRVGKDGVRIRAPFVDLDIR